MGLTGGCVRVCAPVPHRSAAASVCQARLCFPASCRGDSSQQQLSCQGTGRMLLVKSCSLPVKNIPNIPRGRILGLLSMICPWGAAGVALAGACPWRRDRDGQPGNPERSQDQIHTQIPRVPRGRLSPEGLLAYGKLGWD